MLRIGDVYPGSQILAFIHPGARIPDQTAATKEEGEKISCPTFFVASASVLQFRSGIRDLVHFLPLDPGSGMGKKSRYGSGMNILDHIFENLETIF